MRTPSQARSSIIAAAMVESLFATTPPAPWRGVDQARWMERQGEPFLARKLARCQPGHRCLSPACLHCRAIEQVITARVIKKRVRAVEDAEVGFVTIVPHSANVPLGALGSFDADNFSRRIRDGLTKTDAWWAAGAIDLSVNAHGEGAFEAFWQPHAAMMVATERLDNLKRQLKAVFPSDHLTPRPAVIKRWDGRSTVFPYLHKSNFSRRITVEDQLRYNKTTGEWRTCRATTYSRLRAAEELEIARFLDRVGLGGRVNAGVILRRGAGDKMHHSS